MENKRNDILEMVSRLTEEGQDKSIDLLHSLVRTVYEVEFMTEEQKQKAEQNEAKREEEKKQDMERLGIKELPTDFEEMFTQWEEEKVGIKALIEYSEPKIVHYFYSFMLSRLDGWYDKDTMKEYTDRVQRAIKKYRTKEERRKAREQAKKVG